MSVKKVTELAETHPLGRDQNWDSQHCEESFIGLLTLVSVFLEMPSACAPSQQSAEIPPPEITNINTKDLICIKIVDIVSFK